MIDIRDKNRILILTLDYMASHEATYMSLKEIVAHNALYNNDSLTRVIQYSKLKKSSSK
ncbi:MAG: hypothetical protein ACRYE9_01115 [Janthinobacterium lividum]